MNLNSPTHTSILPCLNSSHPCLLRPLGPHHEQESLAPVDAAARKEKGLQQDGACGGAAGKGAA